MPGIAKRLWEEGMLASRQGIHGIKRYEVTGSIRKRPGSGRVTDVIRALVDQQMRADNETSACQLHKLLISIDSNHTALQTSARVDISWKRVLSYQDG